MATQPKQNNQIGDDPSVAYLHPRMRPLVSSAMPPICAQLRVHRKVFGDREILGQLELVLREGECTALLGPSGIGKSTILRILAGLDTDFEGTCSAPGRIAVVFQEPVLLPWRKVRRNLTLTTELDEAGAELALSEVGLAGLGDLYPGQLSLGQQRRLSLARAFAAGPELLLMDEAFVSLDADTMEEMYALFERLRASRGTTTLMVTHDAREADRLGTRVLHLSGWPATLTEAR